MSTRVVHVNDMPNYPDAIYIGRANGRKRLTKSFWANPYTVRQFGRMGAVSAYEHRMRAWCLLDPKNARRELAALAGKPLACWCRRDGETRTEANACHGDILVQLIQELGLEQAS